MKNIFYALGLIAIASGCQEVEDNVMLNSNATMSVSLSTDAVLLIEDNALSDAVTVSWTTPNTGFQTAINYTILLDVSGGDFSAPQSFNGAGANEKTLSVGALNNKLLSLGLDPDVASTIDVKVMAQLDGNQSFMSNTVQMSVTPYSTILNLSTAWGVVGSATPGGWGGGAILDVPFWTTATDGVIVSYVTLRDGMIKFRKDNLWTENVGSSSPAVVDGAAGTLEAGGPDIAVSAGRYKITFDTNTLTYTMETFSWGIVGSGTENGWDGPDQLLYYNSYADNFKGVVTFVDGEVKFRKNNNWDVNLGDNDADLTLEQGGANIVVTAGHYLVTLDLNAMEYSLEPMDAWGLVGSGTSNGWDGPDQKFLPDFGINPGVYTITGATLVDGEIKIRQNDAWGVNYGDDGNNGSLELNGANIPVTAGTYNITFDFNNLSIVMNAWAQ